MESHGNGRLNERGYYNTEFLKKLGKKTVLEEGVLLFHPENISIHDNVYIGHNTILKGYYKNGLAHTQKEMNVHNKLQKENVLKYAYRTKLKENIFIIRCIYYYTLHIFTGKK